MQKQFIMNRIEQCPKPQNLTSHHTNQTASPFSQKTTQGIAQRHFVAGQEHRRPICTTGENGGTDISSFVIIAT